MTYNKPKWDLPIREDDFEGLVVARPRVNPLSKAYREGKIGFHTNVLTKTTKRNVDYVRREVTATSPELLAKLEDDLGEVERDNLLNATEDPWNNSRFFEGKRFDYELVEVIANRVRIDVRSITPNQYNNEDE